MPGNNGTYATPDNLWIGRPVVVKPHPLRRDPGRARHSIDGLLARIEGTIVNVYTHNNEVWFKVRANPSHGEGEGWIHASKCEVL